MAGVVSHPLLCAEKPEGKTDSTGDGADSVICGRLIMQDIWLLCIKNMDDEEERTQTSKDFPLSDATN